MSTDGAPVTEGSRGRGRGAGGCGRNNTPSFGKSDDCMIDLVFSDANITSTCTVC